MPKKQNQSILLEDKLSKEDLLNSCFNEIDYQILELDVLKERHRKSFRGKELKYKPQKKRDLKNRKVVKIKTNFSRGWVSGAGKDEAEAMKVAIAKVKESWPKKCTRADRFVRYFKNFSFRNN